MWPWVPRSTVRVTWFFLTYLISSTSKMLESTPRWTSYHVFNRRWERSCKKVFDLDSQGHAMKIEFFNYHHWIPRSRKHTHEEYLKKNSDGKAEIQGGGCCINPPPLGVFGWRNTLGICGLMMTMWVVYHFFRKGSRIRFSMVDFLKFVTKVEIQDGVQDGRQDTQGQLSKKLIAIKTWFQCLE